MPKFLLSYHGGKMPDSPAEGEKVMAAWNKWFGALGPAIVDGGSPVGKSHTVTAKGVTQDGGPNPVSGYSILMADDYAAATAMAKGCPIIEGGHGSVEVAQIVEM